MKKILSSILAAAMIVGAILSAFPAVVSAADAEPLHVWNLRDTLKADIAKATAGVNDQFVGVKTLPNSVFDVYTQYYPGWGGLGVAGMIAGTNEAFSYIIGINDSNGGSNSFQQWKTQLVIAEDDVSFEHCLNTEGTDAQYITFKAPANGVYDIIPTVQVTSNSKWSWVVRPGAGNTSEYAEVYSGVVEAGTPVDFSTIKGIELNAGDTIEFVFTQYNANQYGYGYAIQFDFDISIVEEFGTVTETVPGIYGEETEYNALDAMSIAFAKAAEYDKDTWIEIPTVFGDYKGFNRADYPINFYATATSAAGTWVGEPSRDYRLVDFAANGDIYFAHADDSWGTGNASQLQIYANGDIGYSMKNAQNGYIRFTAPYTGRFTFSGTTGGAAIYKNAVVVEDNGTKIPVTPFIANTRDLGKDIGTIDLEAGETIDIYIEGHTGWNVAGNNVNGFKVVGKETIEAPVYDTIKLFTTANENIAAAKYEVDEEGTFSVTLKGADRFTYTIWADQNGEWVRLADMGDGVYALENAVSANGAYKVYFLAANTKGRIVSEQYKNYIDVTSAEIGNAIIGNVAVDGKVISDKAYVDFADGMATIAIDGENLGDVVLYVDGVEYDVFSDGELMWFPDDVGTYTLTVSAAAADESKLGDEVSFEVIVYDSAAEDTNDIADAEVVVEGEKINVSIDVADEEASLYTFNAVAIGGGFVIGSEQTVSDKSFELKMGVRYGIYNVFAEARDANGKTEDIVLKRIEYKRPGGDWSIETKLNGVAVGGGASATVGETYTIDAEAAFSGTLDGDVKYAFMKEDAAGGTLVQNWSTDSTFDFTPVAAGIYGITIMAKGGIAGSAEITKTITFVVDPADLTTGRVAVSVSGNTAKKPITFTASRTGVNAADDVLYRFDIYNAKTGAIMVSSYSHEASCTWIPAKAGSYEVRVKAINQNSFGMYDIIGTTTFDVQ